MILILSNSFDLTTNIVIDWIKQPFLRINKENAVNSLVFQFCFNKNIINIQLKENITIDLNSMKSFWYIRSDFDFETNISGVFTEVDSIKKNFETEWQSVKSFLHFYLENKKSLGSFSKEICHNKISTLFLAEALGLQIPPTIITTQKDKITAFQENHGNCIVKAINNMYRIQNNKFAQAIGTKTFDDNNLKILNENVFPILIQKNIEKAFELRIYYMEKHFYSMAIFSQSDKQTELDYRNYNTETPNRVIPFILPKGICKKLQLLMNKLDLDSGSIDMIVTPKGEYVFLEVNPTGQFGWVSENCNYYLEEKIANYLQNIS